VLDYSNGNHYATWGEQGVHLQPKVPQWLRVFIEKMDVTQGYTKGAQGVHP
jgi:hypothetical protein